MSIQRQPEKVSWFDAEANATHEIQEEGHLFRWKRTHINTKGERETLDYGLVPGGVFAAVHGLVQITHRTRRASAPGEIRTSGHFVTGLSLADKTGVA
jgi:hypothetical protein